MKLRIHGNSLRLRLSRADVAQLQQTGACSESITFSPVSQLTYALETSSEVTAMEAQYREDCIRILLPVRAAQAWGGSEQVSLSLGSSESGGPSLLIEKDFACLHPDEASGTQDVDAFPNPNRTIST